MSSSSTLMNALLLGVSRTDGTDDTESSGTPSVSDRARLPAPAPPAPRWRPALLLAFVAVGPGADAHLVALRVGQHPEGAGVRIVDQPSAGREGGLDPGLGLVMGHRD